MELKCFIQNYKNINVFLEKCNECTKYLKPLSELMCDEELTRSKFEGVIFEKSIMAIILRAQKSDDYSLFLGELVRWLETDEVTPNVFNAILSLKSKYLQSILINLCHADLSFYQEIELCKMKIDANPFCKILKIMLTSDLFSVYDVEKLLIENTCWKQSIIYILKITDITNTKKRKVMEKFV